METRSGMTEVLRLETDKLQKEIKDKTSLLCEMESLFDDIVVCEEGDAGIYERFCSLVPARNK